MMIETLQSRQLLAASVSFVGGVVTVTATSAETINVLENGGSVHVEAGANQFDFVGATTIKINGSSKNDVIFYTGNSIGATINANDGNDQVSVDDEGTGSSTVNGGKGNDSITVINGSNTQVDAGDGDDQVYVNGGSANVSTGKGTDTLTVYGGSVTADGGTSSGNNKDKLIDASYGTASITQTGFELVIVYT